MSEAYGPPCPYRQAGKTWKAGLTPYSPEGLSIIAQHNGVKVDALSMANRHASNPYMQNWMHRLGVAQGNGVEVRPNGRWLTPEQLCGVGA